jgi:DNA primase
MRFSPQFLDELRARLPVSEVVGRRVKLRKAGREWKGLSPFNKEKTPSFFVNDQKQAWFDFSSGKNGSIFDFLMITEGLSFPEAVERLAAEAGMPLPKVSHEEEAREEKRRSLADVMESPAPRRAAISPTAASIRPRRLGSASATRLPSASRSRSISAIRASRSTTWWRPASSFRATTSRCLTTASAIG